MNEIRWASLGYYFQWTERFYSDKFKGEFPEDLNNLTRSLAKQFGYDFTPEAATINFYNNAKQTMGGHLDDAEEDLTKPIISCSFGNSVIFLIGGITRDIRPKALFVRSGDVVIMSGHSRYCFHGVARVIEDTSPSFLFNEQEENMDYWDQDCKNFIKTGRINMNVRQVKVKNISVS